MVTPFSIGHPQYSAYQAADPYFNLVRGALADLVDGEHFFETRSPPGTH
jgi:uncharacterized protein